MQPTLQDVEAQIQKTEASKESADKLALDQKNKEDAATQAEKDRVAATEAAAAGAAQLDADRQALVELENTYFQVNKPVSPVPPETPLATPQPADGGGSGGGASL